MKIKLLLSTLLLTLILCSIFGLTACGGNNDNGNNSGGGNSTIAVTSVTLNRSSLNLEIGDTVSLYETIYPSNFDFGVMSVGSEFKKVAFSSFSVNDFKSFNYSVSLEHATQLKGTKYHLIIFKIN